MDNASLMLTFVTVAPQVTQDNPDTVYTVGLCNSRGTSNLGTQSSKRAASRASQPMPLRELLSLLS